MADEAAPETEAKANAESERTGRVHGLRHCRRDTPAREHAATNFILLKAHNEQRHFRKTSYPSPFLLITRKQHAASRSTKCLNEESLWMENRNSRLHVKLRKGLKRDCSTRGKSLPTSWRTELGRRAPRQKTPSRADSRCPLRGAATPRTETGK